MGNTTLTEFSDVEPPRIVKQRPVPHPWKTRATAGHVVRCHSRETNAYYSTRREEKHLFKKYNSYAVSASIIGRLQSEEFAAERVYILEQDTGDLYEFDLAAFLNAPEWENEVTNREGDVIHTDLQLCPDKDEDSLYVWPNLGRDVFRT